jgi:sucrose-6-phosphate hydrolase SacC (GH32 family)
MQAESLRAKFHLTPPDHWLSDPQRPVYLNQKYTLYYLYSDPNNSPGGWRRAVTEDNVLFQDKGISIPLSNGIPVWTGSTVLDTDNTAGFGENALIAIMTQPTDGNAYQQEQYLWYSNNNGETFSKYEEPVIKNTDNSNWFRDPKIIWDKSRSEWVVVIGRAQSIVFYTSKNLKDWIYKFKLDYTEPNIGGMECPDLYQITADDGTEHWILGASVQGDYSGKVNTFVYWTGLWNGDTFICDEKDPQWLDYGWDWYAAVSWPDNINPESKRCSIAWMNNWEYANREIPTDNTDGYNGQMSLVRNITLILKNGKYQLKSVPVSTLDSYVKKEISIPDIDVEGTTNILYKGTSYKIEADLTWDKVSNFGFQIGKTEDEQRHTDIGIFENNTFYFNRSRSERTEEKGWAFYPWVEAHAPFDEKNTEVHIEIFVDKQSVEVYLSDEGIVSSNQVFFEEYDTGVAFYSIGGVTKFKNVVIKELSI